MVTFPFLFGVMFGDIGHGFLLFIFGLYLCIKKDSLSANKDLSLLLKGRYIFIMLGFFSTYCGFIYNDMMSMPLNLFGSCYDDIISDSSTDSKSYQVKAILKTDCVYPFGFDPKWYISTNELQFFNSFKMKFAVIIGVLQMTLGILLKGLNSVYFRSTLDFIFEFLPQIIFLTCLFGFMDLLIILKWLTDYKGKESLAPSIITQTINNFLSLGKINGSPLIGSALNQQSIS